MENRPPYEAGSLDAFLPETADMLARFLADAQRDLAHDTLRLRKKERAMLAGLLVDFAEDLHASAGIWRAYERYNTEFFGSPLPITERTVHGDIKGIHIDRVRHFLWMVYPQLCAGLILSPTHQGMERIAEAACSFLVGAFRSLPRDSGVKAFLQTPNQWGWDVKRKLIWLGTKSYIFRLLHAAYLKEHNRGKPDIGCTDDFLCQECTRWSGLGTIDILAGAIDISDDDRRDLRGWYERHASFYRIVSVTDDILGAVNMICDRPYRIRLNMPGHPFRPGQMIFGSLVPWRGEWYWSGLQQKWDDAAKVDVEGLRDTMKRTNSKIACRFWPEYAAKVRERAVDIHRQMMAFSQGKDLIVYSDGLSMAADWQKELRANWEPHPQAAIEEVVKRHGMKDNRANMKIPKTLLEDKNGIGVFIHPDEGKEIMGGFNDILAGFRRKGQDLTEDEMYAVRGFFASDMVSPQFVHRVAADHGNQSIKAVYLLGNDAPAYWLDYLLRSHKGQYYRKRYPRVSVI